MEIRTRFAPSPTGELHIGGARTALFNYLFAKSMKGKFLLRIEDTDLKRSNSSLSEKIINDIKWLKIPWDEEIVFQQQNQNEHKRIIDFLLEKGLAFRCYSNKDDLTETSFKADKLRGTVFRSPWRDRVVMDQPSMQNVVRFKVPNDPSQINFMDKIRGDLSWDLNNIEDFIIARSDGSSTYNLAVVVDDHNMKISHVIRGEDHLTNTVKQLLIYQALDWAPPIFAHIPLIHNATGEKLSKRDGKSNLVDFKHQGFLPDAMLNYLARLGWSHQDEEFFNLNQAISWFTLEAIGKSPSRFDIKKLDNINATYMREISETRLFHLLETHLCKNLNTTLDPIKLARLTRGLSGLRMRAKNINELAASAMIYIVSPPINMDEKADNILSKDARQLIRGLLEPFNKLSNWNKTDIEETLKNFATCRNIKFGSVALPLRAALTGTTSSPDIFEVIEILGKEEVVQRIEAVC